MCHKAEPYLKVTVHAKVTRAISVFSLYQWGIIMDKRRYENLLRDRTVFNGAEYLSFVEMEQTEVYFSVRK